MFTFLIILLLVTLTYLIADFRRHLEIENIKTAHAAQMNLFTQMAFDNGVKVGVRNEMRKTGQPFMQTLN